MILHIAADSSSHIIYPFIKLVNQHFDKNEHFFILCSADKNIHKFDNAVTKDVFTQKDFFLKQIEKAKIIILHGLWYNEIIKIYRKNPLLFEKTIWRPWGGEYYFSQDKNKKWFISNVKYIAHTMREEYSYIKKRFATTAKYFELVIYDLHSSINKSTHRTKKTKKTLQVGNSSDPSNNHSSIFLKLKKLKNVDIFCPLVYGNKKYKKKIIIMGKRLFKSNFGILSNPVSLQEYQALLNDTDIAFFNHRRQQALGNTISLLILGKKIYLNHRVTSYKFFRRIGLKVFNINKKPNLIPLNDYIINKNRNILVNFFSKKRILNDLKKLFGLLND